MHWSRIHHFSSGSYVEVDPTQVYSYLVCGTKSSVIILPFGILFGQKRDGLMFFVFFAATHDVKKQLKKNGFFTLVPLVVHHCSLLPLIFIPPQFYPTLVPFAQQSTWSPSPSILTCLTGRAHCKIPLQPHLLFLPTPDSNSPSLWFA